MACRPVDEKSELPTVRFMPGSSGVNQLVKRPLNSSLAPGTTVTVDSSKLFACLFDPAMRAQVGQCRVLPWQRVDQGAQACAGGI